MKTKPFLSFWQIWNLTFGFLGIQFGFALQNANSSRILQTYGADVEQLSLFWLAAPLTGMIIQPIIGHYSDQTWCRLGRRRPFFLVGAIFTTIALILMPNAGLFLSPGTETAILSPVLIGAGMLMIMDASTNVTMEPFRALVGDMLPDEQHTTGFSIQTFLIGIGAVVGSLLPSIMNKVFGLSNTAVAGEVADNVKFAFYAGAAILLASVLWTIFKTKEYSPEEMAEFRLSGGEVIEKRRDSNGFMEIMHDIFHMPKIMLQLGLCQFFAWFALYSMWVYSTPAIAEHVYGATDPASAEYAMAGDKVVLMQGIFQVGGRALQLLDGRNGLLADRAVRIFRIDQRQVVGRDGHTERFERFTDAFLLFSGQLDVFLELIYGLNPVFYLPVPVVPLLVGHFGKEFFSAAHCGCERCHLILFVSFDCYVVAVCVFSPM